MRKIIGGGALVLTLLGGSALFSGAQAGAGVPGFTVISDAWNVRSAPNSGSEILTTLYAGTPVTIACQDLGETVSVGGTSGIWNRIDGPVAGWISDLGIAETPYGQFDTRLPLCSDPALQGSSPVLQGSSPVLQGAPPPPPPAPAPSREQRAVEYAASQVGVVYTDATGDGMWSGWCEKLVEAAYGTTGWFFSAAAHYQAALASGQIRTDASPPAGAAVFYSWGSYGHVGIAVGDGTVISTQGDGSVALPVRHHGLLDIGLPYLGWAPTPADWPGR